MILWEMWSMTLLGNWAIAQSWCIYIVVSEVALHAIASRARGHYIWKVSRVILTFPCYWCIEIGITFSLGKDRCTTVAVPSKRIVAFHVKVKLQIIEARAGNSRWCSHACVIETGFTPRNHSLGTRFVARVNYKTVFALRCLLGICPRAWHILCEVLEWMIFSGFRSKGKLGRTALRYIAFDLILARAWDPDIHWRILLEVDLLKVFARHAESVRSWLLVFVKVWLLVIGLRPRSFNGACP